MTNLPENVKVRDYQGDVVLTSSDMTATKFSDIKATLRPEDQQRVMGWLRTGR